MAISLAAAALMASAGQAALVAQAPQDSLAAAQAAEDSAPEADTGDAAPDVEPAPTSPPPAAANAEPALDGTVVEAPADDAATAEDEPVETAADGKPVIVVTGSSNARKKDPLVEVNEAAFAITQDVDKALVAPIAGVYEDDLPSPVRKGLRNFFRNLLEPVTALNYLLQLKPGKAVETLGRFTINSTVGVAGLFDVAKKEPFNLPHRRNGFANTLGYYGVEPGPFLVLPLVGATTLRDLIGGGIDQSFLPLAVGKPFGTPLYAIPAYTVNSLEFRIDFDERLEQINTSDDPYFAMRESYLCLREADIAALKNRPPPRDCSIAALMEEAGYSFEQPGVVDAGAETSVDQSPAPEESVAAEPEAPSEPPAIIYISEEVIQPLPAD